MAKPSDSAAERTQRSEPIDAGRRELAGIRPCRTEDLSVLREIELAAGEAFITVGMAAIAADEPPPVEELARYADDGRGWVAVDGDGRPIGYVIVDRVDGCCHVEQVSVHPDASRQGIGRQLLDTAEQWAVAEGLDALTLTTFVAVAWNGPYYERCGFRFLDRSEETAGLRAIRANEAELGLDRWERACMRRELGPTG